MSILHFFSVYQNDSSAFAHVYLRPVSLRNILGGTQAGTTLGHDYRQAGLGITRSRGVHHKQTTKRLIASLLCTFNPLLTVSAVTHFSLVWEGKRRPKPPLILQISEYAPLPQSFVLRGFLLVKRPPRPQNALHDIPPSKRMLMVDGAIKLLIKLKLGAPAALLPTTCRSSQMKSFWTYRPLILDN